MNTTYYTRVWSKNYFQVWNHLLTYGILGNLFAYYIIKKNNEDPYWPDRLLDETMAHMATEPLVELSNFELSERVSEANVYKLIDA